MSQDNDNTDESADKATRGGDIQGRWPWVERSVWNRRMLTALETGVKGGKWYSLNDKVTREKNLRAAARKVIANRGSAGVDNVSVEMFEGRLDTEIEKLIMALEGGQYRPQAVRRVDIPKPGTSKTRPLGIPTVRDRVVQTALRHALEPIFERDFAEHSYGFRPGRGCKDALRRVNKLLTEGHVHVVDADIQGYFDAIPKDRLMASVQEKVTDKRVLSLIQSFLDQEVMDQCSRWTPERGTPQGAVISPLLANIYLDPLDHLMAAEGFEMTRYADDFVIMCTTRADAERALVLIEGWMAEVELTLHPEKTHIAHGIEEGFEFLGYRFANNERWPRKKSLKSVKDQVRAITKRTNGHSLATVIARLNRTLRGWFEYYKHSKYFIFERLDRYLRVRLRNLLRKRSKRKGFAKGMDHRRWPNQFFADAGLFSLYAAYAEVRQSASR
jgi:RNA-directed DNA polymerase